MDLLPGEIYEAFDGSGRVRPYLVVSRSELNRGRYFLAVPFTSARIELRRHLPNCIYFSAGSYGLPKNCVAQADALTQLRKTDLTQPPARVGNVERHKMERVVRAIGYVIQAECELAL